MTPAPEGGKVFSDEDLKRLKAAIPHVKGMRAFGIPDLLARLEAAEALIGLENGINFRQLYARWQRASGKPQEGK